MVRERIWNVHCRNTRRLTSNDAAIYFRRPDAGSRPPHFGGSRRWNCTPFGKPTGYELIHNGKRYAPKAVVGLAFRYSVGRILSPEEFSDGEAPGEANFVLRRLEFTITTMDEGEKEPQTGKDWTEAEEISQQVRQRVRHRPNAFRVFAKCDDAVLDKLMTVIGEAPTPRRAKRKKVG